jgi:hypothetical protein
VVLLLLLGLSFCYFSTDAVHDYAYLLQILIVVGLLLLAFPKSARIGLSSISFKTATLMLFFYVISISNFFPF